MAIVKKEYEAKARALFRGTKVKIQVDGGKYLGAGIGTENFRRQYLKEKIAKFSKELELLSTWTEDAPHECYCCFTKSLFAKWRYLMRTMGCFFEEFLDLEETIDELFLPKLFDREIDKTERKLFSLPAKAGGIGIPFISELAKSEHEVSKKMTEALTNRILKQSMIYDIDEEEQKELA